MPWSSCLSAELYRTLVLCCCVSTAVLEGFTEQFAHLEMVSAVMHV
jgi:hypothetical protein